MVNRLVQTYHCKLRSFLCWHGLVVESLACLFGFNIFACHSYTAIMLNIIPLDTLKLHVESTSPQSNRRTQNGYRYLFSEILSCHTSGKNFYCHRWKTAGLYNIFVRQHIWYCVYWLVTCILIESSQIVVRTRLDFLI